MDKDKQPQGLEEQWLEQLLAADDPLAFVEAELVSSGVPEAKSDQPSMRPLVVEQPVAPVPEPEPEPVPVQKTEPAPEPEPVPVQKTEPAPEPEIFKDDEFRAAFGEGE